MKIELQNKNVEIGDIVFIQISNFLYRRVAEVSKSWTSHVGIIISENNVDSLVAESRIPKSSLTSLQKFIQRSNNNNYSIKRLKGGLNNSQKKAIINEAKNRLGIFYHLGFNLDSTRQFCSKYVDEVYWNALGIHIGKIETFKDLLHKNNNYSLLFWKLWFLGNIPWKRRTISPGSQYESTALETVVEKIEL